MIRWIQNFANPFPKILFNKELSDCAQTLDHKLYFDQNHSDNLLLNKILVKRFTNYWNHEFLHQDQKMAFVPSIVE